LILDFLDFQDFLLDFQDFLLLGVQGVQTTVKCGISGS